MTILRFNMLGSPNIGVFSLATDKFIILPNGLPERKVIKIEKTLNAPSIVMDLAYSKLIGALASANSNGIILPHYVDDDEVSLLKRKLKVNVEKVLSTKTSFGNLVLANDKKAIVSPILTKKELKIVEDVLDVEACFGVIAGSPYVGSVARVTNKGIILHPKTSKKEEEIVSKFFDLPVVLGTVNNGVPFIASGIVINSYGALVGSLTTGPELMIISSIL
ncbi:MAG: translation initiation factor IF-6 [Candidatus Bathyarchaeota archaeon]